MKREIILFDIAQQERLIQASKNRVKKELLIQQKHKKYLKALQKKLKLGW